MQTRRRYMSQKKKEKRTAGAESEWRSDAIKDERTNKVWLKRSLTVIDEEGKAGQVCQQMTYAQCPHTLFFFKRACVSYQKVNTRKCALYVCVCAYVHLAETWGSYHLALPNLLAGANPGS